jgi:transcriptional regulator with XRE-family HTH domain
MPSIYSRMFQKFKDKRYRDAFLASQIRRLIPKQVRAMREVRKMTQQELADAAHTTQTVISRIEKGGGNNLTIKSLLNLASALDVALVVRFEPIDRFITWNENLSSDDIMPRSSEAILGAMEQGAREEAIEAQSPPKDTNHLIGSRRLRIQPERPSATSAIQLSFKLGEPSLVPSDRFLDVSGNQTSNAQLIERVA